jgi:hypothetical protein
MVAGLVLAVTIGGAVWWSQAGAEPGKAIEPGLAEAQGLLDCGAGEGVFAYHAAWSEGSGFASPREALDALLKGKDFGVATSDFQGTDIQLGAESGDAIGTQFVAGTGKERRVVVWAMPDHERWLADSVYGCTRTEE